MTIYKSFIRPLLDYADVIYDQLSNASFSKKIESVQYNAVLAITEAIKASSREKLYEDFGWAIRLCLLYNVFSTVQPPYIYNLLAPICSSRRHVNSFNSVCFFNLNISRTLSFLISLKAHRKISKKWCFEKYRSCFSFIGYILTKLLGKPNN